jgi:hypothetical protein
MTKKNPQGDVFKGNANEEGNGGIEIRELETGVAFSR